MSLIFGSTLLATICTNLGLLKRCEAMWRAATLSALNEPPDILDALEYELFWPGTEGALLLMVRGRRVASCTRSSSSLADILVAAVSVSIS